MVTLVVVWRDDQTLHPTAFQRQQSGRACRLLTTRRSAPGKGWPLQGHMGLSFIAPSGRGGLN